MHTEPINFDDFLKAAWQEHADAPQAVADRLAAAMHRVQTAVQLAPFVRLLVHVHGEHLGQWARGAELLQTLRPVFTAQVDASVSLEKGIASLRYCAGDAAALDRLLASDRAGCLATVASACAARTELGRAIGAYSEALRIAEEGLPSGSPSIRELAVAGNNLACTLEGHPARQVFETQAMLAAAAAALKYWKLAGTWLEEERAHYRLARSQLQAGEAQAAIDSAQHCVDLCQRHHAPAFELLFGYAALAMAHRSAQHTDPFKQNQQLAMQQWHQVPEEDRPWCQDDLDGIAD